MIGLCAHNHPLTRSATCSIRSFYRFLTPRSRLHHEAYRPNGSSFSKSPYINFRFSPNRAYSKVIAPCLQSRSYSGPYPSHAASYVGANRLLTRVCIGTCIVVYAAWDYAGRGLVYSAFEKQRVWLQSLGVAVPRSLDTRRAYDFLSKYFVLNTNNPENYPSWIGAAFSHRNFIHILFNTMIWANFAQLLYPIPTVHYATLIFGSAMASSGLFMYDHGSRAKSAHGLGASGIVSGILATVTMIAPTLRVTVFGIVPAPLWAMTGGYFLLDTYLMRSEVKSPIGHSAHVGGAIFGAVYYAIFLRRFGGLLGPRGLH